jgi:chromosome segregation ATPase
MMQRQELDFLLEKYDMQSELHSQSAHQVSNTPSSHTHHPSPSSSSSRNGRDSDQQMMKTTREFDSGQEKLRQLKSQIAELSETHSGLKYTIEYLKTSPSKLTRNKDDIMRLRAELADLVTYRVARDMELKEAYQKLQDEVTESTDAKERLVEANNIIELMRSEAANLKNSHRYSFSLIPYI